MVLHTVIIGSFRRHIQQIMLLKHELQKRQVAVLSPGEGAAVNPEDEFVVFSSDPVAHPKLLQDSVFIKIKRSTFVVVANIDGYIGSATLIEIGYAIANGIDIYTLEPVNNVHLIPYCKTLKDIFSDINVLNFNGLDNWESAYHSIVSSQLE